MTNPNRHDIQVLNGLVRASIDSADLYHDAAAETADPGHRDLFERRQFEHRRVAEDLGSHIRALGGEPDADGSLLAKAQRAFMDVKHALLRTELSVVDAAESVEYAAGHRFEAALEDAHISATTRESIRRAWDTVRDGHGRLQGLKHSLEGQRDANNRLFPQ